MYIDIVTSELFPHVVDYGALDEEQLGELRELAEQRRLEEEEAADKKSKKKKKNRFKSLKVRQLSGKATSQEDTMRNRMQALRTVCASFLALLMRESPRGDFLSGLGRR